MKNTLENTLNRVGSKFCTIVYKTTKNTQRFCARVQSVGNSYITINDVNAKVTRKINTKSIQEVRSGDLVWMA
jgi:hypothetical protein